MEAEFPSIYNALVYSIFKNYLMRPLTVYQKKDCLDPFTIKMNNKHITISKNLLADMIIAIPGLHYLDVFATADKGQADLIVNLYPQYKNKIEYYNP